MKKLIVMACVLILSIGIAFAGGDQNRGENGSGSTSTGESAQGSPSQDRSGR
ncbi:MAG: hypothetical protein AB7S77_23995 [Desulfatirhabdiaceae bacterium]